MLKSRHFHKRLLSQAKCLHFEAAGLCFHFMSSCECAYAYAYAGENATCHKKVSTWSKGKN